MTRTSPVRPLHADAPRTVAVPRVLSIAGTDPTGGAGIQADLKSIGANGGYGMAAVTALVAQNTTGVRTIHVPPVAFLAEQLAAVSDDVTIDAVKIGMLFDGDVVAAVRDWLDRVRPPVVVLDPVMVAASGDRLLTDAGEDAVRDLVDRADLVTPNVPELAVLLHEPEASTWDELVDQARRLAAGHGVRVLAKGGHLRSELARDALVDPDGGVVEFAAPRVDTRNTHGTGCSLSSAVATLVARLGSWAAAVEQAKGWLTESIAAADRLAVGAGNGPVSHFAGLWERGGTHRPTPAEVADGWWASVADVRAAIDDGAFVRRLGDGSLDEQAFVWYLGQDTLYLRDYSRVLAMASSLAPTAAEQAFWAQSANSAIVTELELHGSWLPKDALYDAAPGPVTKHYVDHLLATAARGDYGTLVAAMLPCYWIYLDVGSRLLRHATDGHPYARWLQTYGEPAFAAVVEEAIRIVTAHAAAADDAQRRAMQAAFAVSARYERDFFAAPLTPGHDAVAASG